MNEIKTVFVLGGGYSPEWEISVKSAKFTYDEVKYNYRAFLVMIASDAWVAIDEEDNEYLIDKNDFSFIASTGEKVKPDFVINVIHGTPGENGLLHGYLEMLGIPHTGCSVLTYAATFDKVWCKRIIAECGVPMARDYIYYHGDTINKEEIVEKLGLPIFVKPSNSGSSFGVTKVKNIDDIEEAINHAYTDDGVVIIEEAINGRELACGVYITEKSINVLPITEIVSDNEYFDFEAKYEGASNEITPADISEKAKELIRDYTIKIYKLLRCKGIVRIDYILSDDIPYFIEINTVPGMSEQSIIPQQLMSAGISVLSMEEEIINN